VRFDPAHYLFLQPEDSYVSHKPGVYLGSKALPVRYQSDVTILLSAHHADHIFINGILMQNSKGDFPDFGVNYVGGSSRFTALGIGRDRNVVRASSLNQDILLAGVTLRATTSLQDHMFETMTMTIARPSCCFSGFLFRVCTPSTTTSSRDAWSVLYMEWCDIMYETSTSLHAHSLHLKRSKGGVWKCRVCNKHDKGIGWVCSEAKTCSKGFFAHTDCIASSNNGNNNANSARLAMPVCDKIEECEAEHLGFVGIRLPEQVVALLRCSSRCRTPTSAWAEREKELIQLPDAELVHYPAELVRFANSLVQEMLSAFKDPIGSRRIHWKRWDVCKQQQQQRGRYTVIMSGACLLNVGALDCKLAHADMKLQDSHPPLTLWSKRACAPAFARRF